MWIKHDWKPATAGEEQADLSQGITIKKNFPDPEGRLQTAWDDLNSFLSAGGVSPGDGKYIIESVSASGFAEEEFRLDIG